MNDDRPILTANIHGDNILCNNIEKTGLKDYQKLCGHTEPLGEIARDIHHMSWYMANRFCYQLNSRSKVSELQFS